MQQRCSDINTANKNTNKNSVLTKFTSLNYVSKHTQKHKSVLSIYDVTNSYINWYINVQCHAV